MYAPLFSATYIPICFVGVAVACLLMTDLGRSLLARQSSVDASVKAVTAELAAHRRSKNNRMRRDRIRARTLTGRSAHVIWIMYSLVSDPRGAVLHFMRNTAATRCLVDATDESLLGLAERSFLGADMEEVAALTNERNPSNAVAIRLAKRHLAEWELFKWCAHLNERVGAAPSTSALLRRAQLHMDDLPAVAFAVTPSGRPANSARKWVERWRQRWGARMGTLRVRESFPMEEMRPKVRTFPHFSGMGLHSVALPFFPSRQNVCQFPRPESGHAFHSPACTIIDLGAFSGPPGGHVFVPIAVRAA